MAGQSRTLSRIFIRITSNKEAFGTAVTAFRIAVDRRFTSSGGEKQTDFFDIVAWRSTAVFVADHFNKGDMIAVRGALQSRQYTDKNGNNRTAIEVVADEISFC